MRDPRYDVLFEPVTIGPVTAPNRFYQVPHCTGMGRQRPHTLAAMRGIKAEGGWGVVCTEYCSIHPSSDDASFPHATLWDDDDIKANALMTEAVHAHGALAGVELWIGGSSVANHDTRLPALGLQSTPSPDGVEPLQSKRLDRRDIENIKRWHRDAANRAVTAGFDIVYVYATHEYLLAEFLDAKTNTRTDEYGGSLTNRLRMTREIIEITLEAVAGKAAVATRFSVDLDDSESYDAFAQLADLPDLWDLTVSDYDVEMASSRFQGEGVVADHAARARSMTKKPVVCVGRYTSPDTMVSMIKQGKQDLIGAARPSIADPFLPNKIKQGRPEDIRECIGCNICYAHDSIGVPLRCTQNPTFGEEWRRGWHPELIPASARSTQSASNKKALVVGAGPAGLEAARVLGERGFEVMLAESGKTLGGRVSLESRLPGLSEWARVRDWRLTQLRKNHKIGLFPDSPMTADDVIDCEADYVLLASGSHWTTDGVGRSLQEPFSGHTNANVISADRLLQDTHSVKGHYLIFDDDHHYLGPLLAKKLLAAGASVTLVCPEGRICSWGERTNEQYLNNVELYKSDATILTNHTLTSCSEQSATVSCIYSEEPVTLDIDWVVPLTRRAPNDELYWQLQETHPHYTNSQLMTIGDCHAPGLIATAVYSGYKSALEIGSSDSAITALRDLPLATYQ